MNDMVILCALMVLGPVFFVIIMVCTLKIFGYLNIELFKPKSPRRNLDAGAAEDAFNNFYSSEDGWVSVNAGVPLQMTTVIPGRTILNPRSQIASQVTHPHPSYSRSRPQISRQSSMTCSTANPVNRAAMSIRVFRNVGDTLEEVRDSFSEPPPPDYNQARLLLNLPVDLKEMPPPTYNECMDLKMKKICSPDH